MNTEIINPGSLSYQNEAARSPGSLPAQAMVITGLLRRLQVGAVHLHFPNGASELFGHDANPVTLRLKSWDVCTAVLKSGDIGFAQTYIDGLWETSDLPRLLETMARNRHALESAIYGTWWGNIAYRLRHFFNRNSKAGSRRNIHTHYDIGNDFYCEWLDASMTYSSALFCGQSTQSLEEAQAAKCRRVLDQLEVKKGARILEVGCGWGGFAEIAARTMHAHVTGLTLSVEQLQFAQTRMAHAGLAKQASFILRDYRDMQGQFDAVASIEMFEAVGEAYWPDYFQCIARSLRQGGRACVQSIVIDEQLFDRYRKGTDFIQQYIFPGGMLPSKSAFMHAAAEHGLKTIDAFAFGVDYAHTLALWRKKFHARIEAVRALGFDERFIRTWDFYLAYCEAGFRAGSIDVMQFSLQKN